MEVSAELHNPAGLRCDKEPTCWLVGPLRRPGRFEEGISLLSLESNHRLLVAYFSLHNPGLELNAVHMGFVEDSVDV
jgi:hypothetical protein